jgi:hypothetical protein
LLIIIVQGIYGPVIQAQEVLLIITGPTAGLTPSDNGIHRACLMCYDVPNSLEQFPNSLESIVLTQFPYAPTLVQPSLTID